MAGAEPVFDIRVSAAKKSTFSKLSQNETAKECYQLGFFAPANADAALAALEMMDFEGIEKVRDRVAQNGTLLTQLEDAQKTIQSLSQLVDQLYGGSTGLTGAAAAASAAAGEKATGGTPGRADARTVTNTLGRAVGAESAPLATAAAVRAMNVTSPQ